MIGKTVLLALTGSTLTLHAGFFDSLPIPGDKESTASAIQTAQTENAPLLSTLTGTLGITDEQAAGGTAALLQAASRKMPASNYGELLKSVPGLESIAGSKGDMLASALGVAGGNGKDSVTAAFKALGMDGSMIGKFVPLLMRYVGRYASTENLSLLQSALSGLTER